MGYPFRGSLAWVTLMEDDALITLRCVSCASYFVFQTTARPKTGCLSESSQNMYSVTGARFPTPLEFFIRLRFMLVEGLLYDLRLWRPLLGLHTRRVLCMSYTQSVPFMRHVQCKGYGTAVAPPVGPPLGLTLMGSVSPVLSCQGLTCGNHSIGHSPYV